jgi:hypothetical protein
MKFARELTPKPHTLPRRALTSAEFSQLEDVPPETEWFANIDNPHTRRAYRNDLKEFMMFAGIRRLGVSTGVILTHPTGVKVTHLGEDGSFAEAADVDPGASSGDTSHGPTGRRIEGDRAAGGVFA